MSVNVLWLWFPKLLHVVENSLILGAQRIIVAVVDNIIRVYRVCNSARG